MENFIEISSNCKVDFERGIFIKDGKTGSMSDRVCCLFEHFVKNEEKIISREELLLVLYPGMESSMAYRENLSASSRGFISRIRKLLKGTGKGIIVSSGGYIYGNYGDSVRAEGADNAEKEAVVSDGENTTEEGLVYIPPEMWVNFKERLYRKGNENWHGIPEKIFKMLEYFVKNEGKVLSAKEIYEAAFDAAENEIAEDGLKFEFRIRKCIYMIREMLKGTTKEIVVIQGKRYFYGDYVESEIEEDRDIVQEIIAAANKESTIAKTHDKRKTVEDQLQNEVKEIGQEIVAMCVVNNLDDIGEAWKKLFGKVDDFCCELERYLVFRKLSIGAAEIFCDDYRMELRQGISEKKQGMAGTEDKLAQDKNEILEAVDRYICFKVSDVLRWYSGHAL